MSIANLFVENNYPLKCGTLECKTFNIGVFNPNNLTVTNDATVQGDFLVNGISEFQNDVALTAGANLSVNGNTTVTGNATVTGATALNGGLTLGAASNAAIGGNLGVTGTTTLAGDLTLNAPANATIGGNLGVTGDINVDGTATVVGECRLSSILFTGGGGQSQFDKYFYTAGVSLVPSGGFPVGLPNVDYKGSRIGTLATLSIISPGDNLDAVNGVMTLSGLASQFHGAGAAPIETIVYIMYGPDGGLVPTRFTVSIANNGVITFQPAVAAPNKISFGPANSYMQISYFV